jgi:hypothetical protein
MGRRRQAASRGAGGLDDARILLEDDAKSCAGATLSAANGTIVRGMSMTIASILCSTPFAMIFGSLTYLARR